MRHQSQVALLTVVVVGMLAVGMLVVGSSDDDGTPAASLSNPASTTTVARAVEERAQVSGCDVALPVERDERPDAPVIVVGPASLAASAPRNLPPRRIRPWRGRDFLRKMPLQVDRNARVRVDVPPRDRKHVGLAYTPLGGAKRVADAVPAIVFQACDVERGSWWPGAVIVDGPRCVRLRFYLDDEPRPEVVRLAFGRDTCGDGETTPPTTA